MMENISALTYTVWYRRHSIKVKDKLLDGGNLLTNLEWTLSIIAVNLAVVGYQTTSQ